MINDVPYVAMTHALNMETSLSKYLDLKRSLDPMNKIQDQIQNRTPFSAASQAKIKPQSWMLDVLCLDLAITFFHLFDLWTLRRRIEGIETMEEIWPINYLAIFIERADLIPE